MKRIPKNVIIAILAFFLIAVVFSLINIPSQKVQKSDLGNVMTLINSEQVKSIDIKGNTLQIALNNGDLLTAQKEPGDTLSNLLKNFNVSPEKAAKVAINVEGEEGWKFWLTSIILPFIIPLIFIIGFLWFMMRQVQGANSKAMNFGQSRAREFNPNQKTKITFTDVAGVKEAKQELVEVVDFLKNPEKYLSIGARIPKGVLLVGSPGTGKTLLAKAVAGEANVPFFSISGSEFVEMFVGVGASRVRDLFARAKKHAPCIIFIDELDAVGRQRGAGLGGSHDEREQTLNQILVEMDGFDPNTNVIVMAATNRPDVLDSALLRPGRFDRQVTLDLPDINDREEILKVHARLKPFGKDVDLRKVAERTPGFSGAELSNLLNEAAIVTAMQNRKEITDDDILRSIDKIILGPERQSHILGPEEKKITAYHEAGHALLAHELPHSDPVRKVSIIARGNAAGFTLKLPSEDRKLHTRSEFIEELAVFLGGRIAEDEIFHEVTTGAQNDLRQATKLAKKIITEFGMSDKLGLRTFGEKEELIFLGREIHEKRDYSEKTAEEIDSEITNLLEQAEKTARDIINNKRKYLDKIAMTLIEKETIETAEFEALFAE